MTTRRQLTTPLRDLLAEALHRQSCGDSCMEGGSAMEPFYRRVDVMLPVIEGWLAAQGLAYTGRRAAGTTEGKRCDHHRALVEATDQVEVCRDCGATRYHSEPRY